MMNTMKNNLFVIIAFMVAVWATPALAADDVVLSLTAQEEVTVIDKKGNKTVKLVVPEHIEPGDVVLYSITYNNKGKKAVDSIVINDPIPANTVYIADSATGNATDITFSVDGKHFAAADKLMVKDDDKLRLARIDEYHHVRWLLTKSLAAGKQGLVSFKVRVK